jgi:hypothetical protein
VVAAEHLTTHSCGQPDLTPVANAQELGERAARAAATDPYKTVPSPGKWLYVKQTIAPLREEPAPEVDRDRRTTLDLWHSVDGKQTALDDGKGKLVIHETGPGSTAADLAKAPVTPEQMLARIRAAIAETSASEPGGADGKPDEQRIVETISRLMSEQVLDQEVRAALFRALPMIPEVSVKQDAVDAAGRHGIAFAYTGPLERFEIILSPKNYGYLGTYGETVATRTFSPPGIGTRDQGRHPRRVDRTSGGQDRRQAGRTTVEAYESNRSLRHQSPGPESIHRLTWAFAVRRVMGNGTRMAPNGMKIRLSTSVVATMKA